MRRLTERRRTRVVGVLTLACVLLGAGPSHAQVTTITPTPGAAGLGTAVAPPTGGVYRITTTRPPSGPNLFYSFDRFSIGTGDTALFANPNGLVISNLLSRVTGADISRIYGTIDSRQFTGANFFLLNPAGVIFGPGATLNVGGSFHVSNADYICLGATGCLTSPAAGKFFARLGPQGQERSVFTADPPAAFGFLGPPTGSIVVEEGANLPGSSAGLTGQTISFVGGEIRVTAATLAPPGGHLRLISVASEGELPISDFDVRSFSRLGPVSISRNPNTGAPSTLDVSGDPSGSVIIRGGNVLIDGSAVIAANTGNANATPPGIDVGATELLTVTNGSTILSSTSGDGRGPSIRLGDIHESATRVLVDGGTQIQSTSGAAGDGGAVSIIGDNVTITGGSVVFSLSLGTARGGDISVIARDSVTMSGAASLLSETDFTGDGGQLFVSAKSLTVDTGGSIMSTTLFSPVSDMGRGGDVTVETTDLTVRSGASITSGTSSAAPAGGVSVTAAGTAQIADPGTVIGSGSFGAAPPGEVTGSFGSLTLTGGAVIQSGVFAGNQGGNVSVTATGPVVISNGSGIGSQAFFGDVGRVSITAPQVVVDNGYVSTATLQSGRGGDISINTGALTLTNGGQLASASIDAATGAGGNVTVIASESFTISGRSPSGGTVLPFPFNSTFFDPRSGIFTTTAGSGLGGNIAVRSPQIRMLDGAVMSAASTGTANAIAGNIDITFGKSLTMDHATITTDSLLADGGNISLTSTGSQLLLIGSQITTSVRSGLGGGGNIAVGSLAHPISIIVLDGSGIHADAFGGPGGNINVFTNVLLTNTPIETTITASSQLSSSGTISVNAFVTDVSSSLAELPSGMLEAAALLRASCAVRMAEGKASSLVIAGREGVPIEPGGLLPSALAEPRIAGTAAPALLPIELRALRLSYLDTKCGG